MFLLLCHLFAGALGVENKDFNSQCLPGCKINIRLSRFPLDVIDGNLEQKDPSMVVVYRRHKHPTSHSSISKMLGKGSSSRGSPHVNYLPALLFFGRTPPTAGVEGVRPKFRTWLDGSPQPRGLRGSVLRDRGKRSPIDLHHVIVVSTVLRVEPTSSVVHCRRCGMVVWVQKIVTMVQEIESSMIEMKR